MLEKVLAPLARRLAWVRTALAVQARFGEVHGGYLASAITLAGFLSIFPLLLVATAVLGYISVGQSDLPQRIIGELGLSGEAATAVTSAIDKAEESRRVASVVGLVGLLWSGLGMVAALQYAYNKVWQVQGRGLKDKAVGLAWLAGAGLIFLASFGLTTAMRWLPGPIWPAGVLLGVAVSTGLFLWSNNLLPNRNVGWQALLPGAVLGGVGLEVLKWVGAYYVPKAVASSSGLYGSIGTVFAILAWLFIFSRLVVYSAVLNVVRWEEDHGTVTVEIELPRLPDEVPITADRSGDQKSSVPAPA